MIRILVKYLSGFVLSVFIYSCDNESQKIMAEQFIFDDDLYGQCHASSIIQLDKNRFLAVWFGGSYEGATDVDVWGAYFNGKDWDTPFKLADSYINDTLSMPCWNPVLHMTDAGKLFLFYKKGPNPREWWGMVKFSDDGGQSWSRDERLPDNVLGPIKNKPLSLNNGTFLAPSSIETLDDKWIAHLEMFSDDGNFLEKIEPDHGGTICAIQPSILRHSDGRLQILCRSRQDYIAQSWSYDGGLTWDAMSLLQERNPNSGTDAITLDDGRHLLVYNPSESGEEWWLGRNVLRVAISDDGINWTDIFTLENHNEGEFSYPAVIRDSEGLIHITYTWKRKRIKHIVLKV
jgi:predicted neuraminidase